jgi:hypothetical protein
VSLIYPKANTNRLLCAPAPIHAAARREIA